jgi:hypothetical protein
MTDFHPAIGFFSLAHITLAGLGVGFMVLTPWAEYLGLSKPHFTQLAYLFIRFTVITYTVSIVLAVFMLELFIGLFPLTNTWLFNHFRYPLYVALLVFFLQLGCLYAYYHYWDSIRAKSVTLHIMLIGLAAVFILIWSSILDGIGSFMLTPVQKEGGWAKLMNPTWLPLVIHRFFGNLVMAGYVLAGYAAWQYGNHPVRDHDMYYATLFKTGLTIGLCTLLIQPFTGLFYAFRIHASHPEVSQNFLQGSTLGLIVVQFSLLATLYWGSFLILQRSHPPQKSSHIEVLCFSLGLAGLLVFSPFPFVRRLITVSLTLFLLWKIHQGLPTFWAHPTRSLSSGSFIRYLAIGLGLASVLLYLSMGTLRELGRGSDTVYGVLDGQHEIETLPQQLYEGR